MSLAKWREAQLEVCREHGAQPLEFRAHDKVGVSFDLRDGEMPINGVRIKPAGGTCGWYIWSGTETSDDDDYFVPLHVAHLPHWSELPMPFLLLPVGWRFLTDGEYVDVWYAPEEPETDAPAE